MKLRLSVRWLPCAKRAPEGYLGGSLSHRVLIRVLDEYDSPQLFVDAFDHDVRSPENVVGTWLIHGRKRVTHWAVGPRVDLADNLVRHPWVSVRERLPNSDPGQHYSDVVIVRYLNDGGIASLDTDKYCWHTGLDLEGKRLFGWAKHQYRLVTHWMDAPDLTVDQGENDEHF